jgi:NADH dehydrogenase (ubiquinone) 1 alpha subcomplex subunit 9
MDDKVKELKLCANLGQSFIVREMNFKNPKMIERVMSTSNVAINLVGPKRRYTSMADHEWVNIEIPKRIARACRENPNILRMIHFSCAGAAEDSPSFDLRTKWRGEQEVLNEFPDATIIRPTTVKIIF